MERGKAKWPVSLQACWPPGLAEKASANLARLHGGQRPLRQSPLPKHPMNKLLLVSYYGDHQLSNPNMSWSSLIFKLGAVDSEVFACSTRPFPLFHQNPGYPPLFSPDPRLSSPYSTRTQAILPLFHQTQAILPFFHQTPGYPPLPECRRLDQPHDRPLISGETWWQISYLVWTG